MKIDPDFRANEKRSICVFGEFNDELLNKLTPQIIQLRAVGSGPITVFINSNGGSTRVLDFLNGLLKSGCAEGARPRIITVAVGFARSAAASLLSLGDYAIAYPKAGIHFHGVRYTDIGDPVTMESASSMAQQLENANQRTAFMLAEAAAGRLAFHYARSKSDFEEIRKNSDSKLSDIECFSVYLKNKLSDQVHGIIDQAIDRWKSLVSLEGVLAAARNSGKIHIDFEAEVLKGIVDFEVKRNRETDWCLDAGGIRQVAQDYLLVRDYDLGKHTDLIQRIFVNFNYAFFSEEEIQKITSAVGKEGAPTDELKRFAAQKTTESIKPFCYFATLIWRGLHEDENPLSPDDAYWLGSIDEVYDSNLPCLRQILEAEDSEITGD